MKPTEFNQIFDKCIDDYHIHDHVDTPITNPFDKSGLSHLLYAKCWIDTVQWHLEDIIRDPNISPEDALKIKRRIDSSNQDRTDMVEFIDSYYLKHFKSVDLATDAKINTESPAWAIDRLSILALKLYHMRQETLRSGVDAIHLGSVQGKLAILEEQRVDLTTAIDQLLDDMATGRNYMKFYKQMKKYNDPSLNPVLYQKG